MRPPTSGTRSALTVSMRRKNSRSAMPNAARSRRKASDPLRLKIRSGRRSCLTLVGIVSEPGAVATGADLDLVAVGEGFVHGDLVDVFEVGADGHPHGDACDPRPERFQKAGDVVGRGFAFGRRVRGDDHLADLDAVVVVWYQSREKIGKHQLVRA